MASVLEHIDDLNFDTEVLGSKQPFLLDFSATWCAPCKALEPILASLAQERGDTLRIGKVDIDSSPGVAARLGVRGAPTLILFEHGEERGRKLGFSNKRALLDFLHTQDGVSTAV
jgi:thioredoxin 1